jgi:Asp-tRNA(Asn)/Glu-tRNA(Gln) amidotransferase A subunit family amidase
MALVAAADAIAAGTLTARALAEAQLARVAATDAAIEAWAHLDPAQVRAEAGRLDAALRDAPGRGPLSGIGIGVKDIIETSDAPTQMGSPIYAGYRAERDAECIARLKRAGGYVFGKAVTTAFAFLDPAKTKNPWNASHTPGGSSSGPAAAVAAGHVAGAIGTQTNGSVIRPAAFCGVVGFKPTKDVISYSGVHLFSETLDQLGTFTRSVADAARLASALADAPRLSPVPAPMRKPPRLAYLDGFPWTQEVDCDADDTLDAAATTLRMHGAEVVALAMPARWREANVVHRTIMLYEGGVHLGSLQGRERARLTPNLNAALDEGRAIAQRDYRAALESRMAAIAAFTEWLAGFDAIITPPAPGPAPRGLRSTGDPSCCTLWSLTGFPALTLPIGFAGNGLPLGMQLAAPAGEDDRLLAVAAWCEARLPFRGLVSAETAPIAGAAE